jgi:hypothetical protein
MHTSRVVVRRAKLVMMTTVNPYLLVGGCVVAGLACLWFAIDGIRSGSVALPQNRHTVPICKDDQPGLFWLFIWLWVGGSIAFLSFAAIRGLSLASEPSAPV